MIFLAKIIAGEVCYKDPKHNDKLNRFIGENENKIIEISYKAENTVKYYQHKYYRGFLLPSIAFCYGEDNLQSVHMFRLKKDFLYMPVEGKEQIPKKHVGSSNIIFRESDQSVVAYIPSTAKLTQKEMDEFIKKCEHRLIIDQGGHICCHKTGSDFKEYQEKAMFCKKIYQEKMRGVK